MSAKTGAATAASTASKQEKPARVRVNPFEPSTKSVPPTKLEDSNHIVTIPHIPELYDPQYLDKIFPTSAKQLEAGAPSNPRKRSFSDGPRDALSAHSDGKPRAPNPFMDALRDESNKMLTTNMSPAYASTLNDPLDFFSSAANADGGEIHKLVAKSWAADPNVTLKLIFCLRSIHDGKSEKDSFYHAFGWLFKNHPKTAVASLSQLVEPVIDRAPKKPKKTEEGEEAKDPKKLNEEEDDEWTEVEKEKEELKLPGYSHGYYKDLLNLVILAVFDQLGKPETKFAALYSERPLWTYEESDSHYKKGKRTQIGNKHDSSRGTLAEVHIKGATKPPQKVTKREKRAKRTGPVPDEAAFKVERAQVNEVRLTTRLNSSPEFKALYIAVARIFATKLAEELETLKTVTEGKVDDEERTALLWKIGLVSKWAPTLGASHDRYTNIATPIALLLHSMGAMSELPLPHTATPTAPLSTADVVKVRSFYRRWIISPLRRQIQIPERNMSAGAWSSINYQRVPAVSMRNSKKQFMQHDLERFKKYLEDVKKGNKSIAGATLLPHQLLGEAVANSTLAKNDPDGLTGVEAQVNLDVVNSQWNALVERLRESGALDNCLALCDVSGSMGSIDSYGYSGSNSQRLQTYNQPIYPAVALSILVSLLAKPPFSNIFVTFSQSPEIVSLRKEWTLAEAAKYMVTTNWGMNTDLQAVFLKLLLPLAKKNNVKQEDMVKRLFIFSDMQFDNCRQGAKTDWTTDHKAITEAYETAGYKVPEIVYWNLQGTVNRSKPVTADQPGVALLSGFSPNLLKVFLDSDADALAKQLEEFTVVGADGEEKKEKSEMNPVDIMLKSIGKKSFAGLKVLD